MRAKEKWLSRSGLAVAALCLALAVQAQEPTNHEDAAGQARRAAEQAAAAVALLESGEAPALPCADDACAPQALAAAYRVQDGTYAGSMLRLGEEGRYSMQLTQPPMQRSSKGTWSLQDGMVVLVPQDDPADAVQLVPYEARSAERAQLQQLLADLQQAHPEPDGRSDEDARDTLQAQLAATHEAGRPLYVSLLDPLTGVASEGVQVVLELAGGELAAESRLSGGNTYRFPSPPPGQAVTGVRLQFPGVDAPLRLPLQAPLRPSYQVLFDACALRMCESATMGMVLQQGADGPLLYAVGVGVFQRESR